MGCSPRDHVFLISKTLLPQIQAQLGEAGDLLTKQVPDAGARVGQGTVEALKGATSNTAVGNPVKEALGSLEEVSPNHNAKEETARLDVAGKADVQRRWNR